MKIQLTTSRSTVTEDHKFGDIIDLPDDEAIRLLNTGQAEPVEAAPEHQRRERRVIQQRESR